MSNIGLLDFFVFVLVVKAFVSFLLYYNYVLTWIKLRKGTEF